MFSVDEAVKSLFFAPNQQESPSGTFAYLVNHHWDQLVVYLLVAPLQWLHTSHLLASTDWLAYGLLGKLTVLLYLAVVFAAWEEVRLFCYVLGRRLQAGDSLPDLVARLLTAGREVHKQTAPLVGQVTKVVSKVGGQATRMIAGEVGKLRASAATPRSSPEVAENFTRRSEKSD